jgi:hypothetical protein
MINHISLTPAGPLWTLFLRPVGNGGIEQQVVDLAVRPQALQRLLGKGPDAASQVGQLKRQNREAVPPGVVPECVVGRLCPADVPRTQDEPVGLCRLRQELLD